MTTATPRQAFRWLTGAGFIVPLAFGGLVAVDLWRGSASMSLGRGKGSVTYLRDENPAAYWIVIRETALVGGAFGGGLIAFGAFVLWINRSTGERGSSSSSRT